MSRLCARCNRPALKFKKTRTRVQVGYCGTCLFAAMSTLYRHLSDARDVEELTELMVEFLHSAKDDILRVKEERARAYRVNNTDDIRDKFRDMFK